ncbi:SH3 domain-containing protein [Rhodohalobacter sp. 614A]|uniref:SH3 domain-containing protein n=1 Tax=Rhodohalobacter sp. 614A TaxID=2908649 RepID=UPI001F37ABDE|nr:SH3 domain-containing protein [Rhodohalobacter sp. 614A]
MKKYIYFTVIIGFSLFGSQVYAQQSSFDQANSFLEEGEYQSAIEIYQSIEEGGYQSGSLWQNMGVAYTRLDSLGKAKYYFLRAAEYSETEDQAEQALAYVNNRFPRQSAVLPTLPWIRFFNFLSANIGLRNLVYISLFFLYLGVALKIGSWFRLDLKKALNYSGYGAIAISAVLFVFSVIIQYQENRYSTGVMVDNESSVYEQPDENASIISTAYEGYTMQIDEDESEGESGWKYIRLENGMYGWIQDNHIMIF